MTKPADKAGRIARGAPRLLLVLAVALALAAFFLLDLDREIGLEGLRRRQAGIEAFVEREPVRAAALFAAIFVAAAACSVPGAVLALSLAAGAIFGLAAGTLLTSLSLTLGSSIAFLGARYAARDWVEARLGARLDPISRGMEREGLFYLLALRLIAVVPYFAVNLAMAVTRIRLVPFALLTLAGTLPSTLLYVNAGTQLRQIDHPSDILSPGLLVSLALLGLFPLAMKRLLARRSRAAAGPLDGPRLVD